jgi:tocopherol O-methyltransferase
MVRPETRHDVGEYYERNTGRFLRFGDNESTASLHRKLWPPGVGTPAEALLSVNGIVIRIIERKLETVRPPLRIIDLGCGIGGIAFSIADHFGSEVTGVTLSPVQARLAREGALKRGLAARCTFQVGDLLELPHRDHFHAAVAVESFSHIGDGERFFDRISALLVGGGLLILVDDTVDEKAGRSRGPARWLSRFERGWHLHGLATASAIRSTAATSGFILEEDRDLTPLIRVNPVLLFLVRPLALVPIAAYGWDTVRGSIALQQCTRKGYSRYRCMVFRKPLSGEGKQPDQS